MSNFLFYNDRGHAIERWCLIFIDNDYKIVVSSQGKHTIGSDSNPFLMIKEGGKDVRDNNGVFKKM